MNALHGSVVRSLLLASILTIGSVANAEQDNCNAWRTAEKDPTGGAYLLDLRTCDLTYGLSAYIEIKNASDKRLHLFYRVTTKDESQKDSDVILEPLSTARTATCQACARRHAGMKDWDILKVEELPVVASVVTTPAAIAPAQSTAVAPSPSTTATAPVQAPPAVVQRPLEKIEQPIAAPKVVPVETPTGTAAPVVNPEVKTATQPVAATTPSKLVHEPAKQAEGFKAEDGTIIPYDQLPPEFRPRKQN